MKIIQTYFHGQGQPGQAQVKPDDHFDFPPLSTQLPVQNQPAQQPAGNSNDGTQQWNLASEMKKMVFVDVHSDFRFLFPVFLKYISR